MITLNHYLILSAVLFVLGVAGVLTRRNALILVMSIELMLNAANVALLAFARWVGDASDQAVGHGLALFVMTVAAAEAAVGLALILAMFRQRGTVNVDEAKTLKG